ncbi:hypothetical protein CISG_05041 [Coccidioides immitis RMSCC 3703]|uniref:Bud22 domain-containing protein n=1 Tax=Coccidioides immitis RMSCC 3703 TaxID=454286 RepID=A0A0J8QSD4_COCIT|nr:hypothetical protein CISG_05041 [Coccidioides immitis RMSCC 3703]
MPKRKREESNEAPAIDLEAQRLTIRAARLEQKIEHGIQQIHRALKTARGFERQKLGRRQKHAQSKNENALLSRLSEEVQALKSLKMAAPKTQPRIETPGVNPEDVSMDEEGNDFDFSQFDDRLASSSGSESEDDDGNTVQRREERRYDPIEDLSLSPTPSTTDSKSPPATVVKSSKSSKATQKPSTTTFLPSLTMGGYWSGTESDAEDDIAAAAITPRKNRMGQQARRKLWEKKFGANANHVRKQTESRNRDSGWDLRRGAMSQEDIGRGRGKGGKFRGQFKTHDEPSTQNERPRNPRGV